MAGRKTYVTPGFIAAMVVLGASGVVIVIVAATFITWCFWKYYRYLRHPSPGMIQIRNRIRETDSIRVMESGSAAARAGNLRAGVGVPPGFTYSLPLIRYSKTGAHLASLDAKGHMSECPVCLTEYKETERIRLLPNCKHVFHPVCINTWLESHTTCPLCRTEVQTSKNARNLSSLDRILSFIRRSGGAQIVDSSSRDRYSVRQPQQRVTVVTPPPPQNSSIFALPLPTADPRSRPPSRELHDVHLYETPSPLSSTNVEPGMIFSSVWGSHFDEQNTGGPSSSSSSSGLGFARVSVTISASEEACTSATGFVAISLDADQPER